MRPLSDHRVPLSDGRPMPESAFLKMAHGAARTRAVARPSADPVTTETVDAVLAEGGHDALLLGAVDPEAWAARERFAGLVRTRILARLKPQRFSLGTLVDDHVELELEARFPALTDELQAVLGSLEREWGLRRDLWSDIAVPGVAARTTELLSLTRATAWPAARLGDGSPTHLSERDDSAQLRMPHHVTVHLLQRQHLVELWMWPPSGEGGWAHVWLLLQDDVRLVPARTAEIAPAALVPGLLDELVPFVLAVRGWWEARSRRLQHVAGPYVRDGMQPLTHLVGP